MPAAAAAMGKSDEAFRVGRYRKIRIQNHASRWNTNGNGFQLSASFPCGICHVGTLFLQWLGPCFDWENQKPDTFRLFLRKRLSFLTGFILLLLCDSVHSHPGIREIFSATPERQIAPLRVVW
jgi:hypothetical protein